MMRGAHVTIPHCADVNHLEIHACRGLPIIGSMRHYSIRKHFQHTKEVFMKRFMSVLLILALWTIGLNAQAKPISDPDEAAIRQTILDYAEGYYSGNAERMERAVHPLLMKRGMMKMNEQDEPFLLLMNSSMLIEAARSGRGKVDPEKRNIAVEILDRNEQIASAKVYTVQFNDFLHLAKVDGQWKIVNVLWCPPVQTPGSSEVSSEEEILKVFADLRNASNIKNAEQVRSLIHPEFIKRTHGPALPGGEMILQDMNGELLQQIVRTGRAVSPAGQPAPEVTVLGVYQTIASVRSSRPGSIEYVHLGKQAGTWRIVNTLAVMLSATPSSPQH
jgi:hypothetical protein